MRTCIGCGTTDRVAHVLVDDAGFEVCAACHYALRRDLALGLEAIETYLQHWADYREWEKAHVAALIHSYTRSDR